MDPHQFLHYFQRTHHAVPGINAQYQYPHARVFILPESVFPFYEKDKHDLKKELDSLRNILKELHLPNRYVYFSSE